MIIYINKRKNNNINKKNIIKGIIYGKNFLNFKIEFEEKKNYYEKFCSNKKIKIKFINKYFDTIIKSIEKHPFKKKILHVDFFLKNE